MDFAGWIDTWRRVLTQPGEPVFEQEKVNPNGSLQTALIWVVIAAVVAAIFGAITAALNLSSANAMLSQLPPEIAAQMGPMLSMAAGGGGFWAIIMVPVFFLIGTFITHLVAKVLGGQGEYSRYAYLNASFQAPITMISSIVALIPFLGGCVGSLLGIYGLVLTYFAVKVNYSLSSGKAIAVVLIPIILVFILLICFGAFFASMLAGMPS
jgi:hypothetical protein